MVLIFYFFIKFIDLLEIIILLLIFTMSGFGLFV